MVIIRGSRIIYVAPIFTDALLKWMCLLIPFSINSFRTLQKVRTNHTLLRCIVVSKNAYVLLLLLLLLLLSSTNTNSEANNNSNTTTTTTTTTALQQQQQHNNNDCFAFLDVVLCMRTCCCCCCCCFKCFHEPMSTKHFQFILVIILKLNRCVRAFKRYYYYCCYYYYY